MSEKDKKRYLEDPVIDPLRESSLTITSTSGAMIIPSKISEDMKLDLPRFKVSRAIGKIAEKREKKRKDKKETKNEENSDD